MKGMSYTLEALIAGFILLSAITFFGASIITTDVHEILKSEAHRCLKEIDDQGSLRPFIDESDGHETIDTEVGNCIKSTINKATSICRDSCNSSSTPPENVTRLISNYYVAGYTDKDPVKISVIMWE